MALLCNDYKIRCTGLRPNTKHKFYVNNSDQQADYYRSTMTGEYTVAGEYLGLCVMENGSPNLITDAQGKITFIYHFTRPTTQPVAQFRDQTWYGFDDFNIDADSLTFSLRSDDGRSVAELNLRFVTAQLYTIPVAEQS